MILTSRQKREATPHKNFIAPLERGGGLHTFVYIFSNISFSLSLSLSHLLRPLLPFNQKTFPPPPKKKDRHRNFEYYVINCCHPFNISSSQSTDQRDDPPLYFSLQNRKPLFYWLLIRREKKKKQKKKRWENQIFLCRDLFIPSSFILRLCHHKGVRAEKGDAGNSVFPFFRALSLSGCITRSY